MPIAAVVVGGAVLTFAVADGSVGAFNQRIADAVLMLGAAALLIPLLLRTTARWNQSTVRSRQDVDDRPPLTLANPPVYDGKQGGTRRASDDRRL